MGEPEPEWCQLPRELVDLISKHLSTEIDFLRFRSVCSSWRSSLPPKPHLYSPSRFPILPNNGISDNSWGFYLSKASIYILHSPTHLTNNNSIPSDISQVGFDQTTSNNNIPSNISRVGFDQTTSSNDKVWILKLDRENPQRMRLFNPLSRSQFKPLPLDFPKILDSSQYPILELSQEYTLQYLNYRPRAKSIGDAGSLYMEKVAVFLEKDGFLLLTIHVSGKLVMHRSGDTKWSIVDDSSLPYDDVICFKDGNFYAVDNTGRVVVVKLSDGSAPELTVVAHPVFGGDKKFLVESCGELLMVDKYLSIGSEDDLNYYENVEFYEEFDCYMSERAVKFKVYKLDRDMQKWVEVNSLEDRILFVGDNSTYSVSASELDCGVKGNCILFTDQFFCSSEDDGVWKNHGVGLFSLENGSIGPISSYRGYGDLFWPPPSWICSAQPIDAELNELKI